jgi:hypothetical protein
VLLRGERIQREIQMRMTLSLSTLGTSATSLCRDGLLNDSLQNVAECRRFRKAFVLPWLLIAVLAFPAGGLCADLELTLQDIEPKSSDSSTHSAYHFVPNPIGEIKALPSNSTDLEEVATASFIVSLDPHATQYYELESAFRYSLFVRRRDSPGGAVTRFAVWAEPTGDFQDQLATTTVTVKSSTLSESTRLRLPIYSSGNRSDILAPGYSKPESLALSGEQPITLSLTNRLALPITVSVKRSGAQARGNLCSSRLDGKGEDNVRIDANGRSGELDILLTPRTKEAFVAALYPGEKDAAHDSISVTLRYATLQGQWRELPPFIVPVRFRPSLPLLLLLAAAGGLIGVFLAALLSKTASWRNWPRAAIAAVIVAAVAEIIGLLLFAVNTEVRLLGFNVNPQELLPAFLIGFLGGLKGLATADSLTSWYTKLKGEPVSQRDDKTEGDNA